MLQFVCERCGKDFDHTSSLRAHERKVHQVFRYRCANMRKLTASTDSSVMLMTKAGVEEIQGDVTESRDRSADVSADVSQSEVETTPSGRVRRRAAVKCVSRYFVSFFSNRFIHTRL